MGKITVKHFLNTRANPVKDEKGNDTYPVFIMVIYDRMTIRKQSFIIKPSRLSEIDFNNKTYSKTTKKGLEYETKLINKIVEKFKNDTENKTIIKDFLNFNSRYSYTSTNENLNVFNSYINFYMFYFCDVLYKHIYDFTDNEISKKLSNSFDFTDNEDIKNEIIENLKDSDLFASYPRSTFLFNNVSENGKKLLFLELCYNRFADQREKKTGSFDIPLCEWLFEFSTLIKEYQKYVLNNDEIISESKKLNIDLENEVKNYQQKELENILFNPLFVEKYRI